MTDQELITGIKNDSTSAKVAFYHRFHAAAYQSAHYMLSDEHQAEDICHETMFKAFEAIKGGKPIRNLKAWIRTVARNDALKLLKGKLHFMEEVPEVEEEEVETKWTDFTLDRILEEISALPSGYQTILKLHLLEDLDHESIGKELGIAAATSRSQYLRGRKKLQQRLLAHHEG